MAEQLHRLLDGYRALDLTNEIGFSCGKILAAMGVDVIKVEKPGGDPSRNIPPFVGGVPDPEKSLYWWSFNTDKRSITLNLEASQGQVLFQRLAAKSDFVIESFTPGYLDSLGLGYRALSGINPRIIVTSITPFGQKGPYSHYKGCELIASAMSGTMANIGDADRAPVREGPDSICFLANAAAAAGSVTALYHRNKTGEGQQVDISLQHVSALRGGGGAGRESDKPKRDSAFRFSDRKNMRVNWQCKDGWVFWKMMPRTVGAASNRALSKWMDDAEVNNPLHEIENWEKLDIETISQGRFDVMQAAIGAFFFTLTKKEIAEEGMKRGINASVINDPADIFDNPQLKARDYWVELDAMKYPRYYFLSSETENTVRRRAPFIGEHNDEIYRQELGLAGDEILALKAAHVI